jgi:hypothetical protein
MGAIDGCADACMGGSIGSCIGGATVGCIGDSIGGGCIDGIIMSCAGIGAGCPCDIAPVLCRSGRIFDAVVANCGSNAATLPASAGNAVRNDSPKG